MIERDDHIPPLAELCAELEQARALSARTLARCRRAADRRTAAALMSTSRSAGGFPGTTCCAGDGAIETHVIGTARVPVADAPGHLRQRLPQPPCRGAAATTRRWRGCCETDFDSARRRLRAVRTTRRSSPSATTEMTSRSSSRRRATTRRVPLLAELARWEWAMAETSLMPPMRADHARAARAVAPEQWAQLRLQLASERAAARAALERAADLAGARAMRAERPGRPPVRRTPAPGCCGASELADLFRSLPPDEAAVLDAAPQRLALRGAVRARCVTSSVRLGAGAGRRRSCAAGSTAGLIGGAD